MTDIVYLPYKSINVFITREYLEKVLQEVLTGYTELPKESAISFNKQFREHVSILGFRNALKAPISLKINAYASAFEEKNEIIPFTLSSWTQLKTSLASEVEDWLKAKGWKELSADRVFNETEGFKPDWPKKLTFKKIVRDFKKAKPDVKFEDDDLILMVIWISGKLPPEETEL